MQLFNTSQIHAWDQYTILHEPVSSIDLMERAATACYNWLLSNGYQHKSFSVYCGKGNNGGDGLAIARMLANSGHDVSVYILEFGHKGTDDFQQNLARLHETPATIFFVSNEETIHHIPKEHTVIDALLGSGLNRALDGLTAALVQRINNFGNEIIAIDLPSGLFTDKSSVDNIVIKANHTLSFQTQKLSFLLEDHEHFLGQVHILDIGLHPGFLEHTEAEYHLTDNRMVSAILRPRKKFSHKGDYGHAALLVGSTGFMGAAVLAARACLRSGVGKLTCHIPREGYTIMQVAAPEAMAKIEKGEDHLASLTGIEKYDAIGVGPGIGLHDSHTQLLSELFKGYRKPIVIDADALNILSRSRELLQQLPVGSILTPHTREFERLFGTFDSHFDRIHAAQEQAKALNAVIVLKGAHTFIATPEGKGYFNNTGNAGMATGGTGDVLTGIITGLLSQGYVPGEAAIAGVYLHGLSGDLAAQVNSMQALIASDLIGFLGQAFRNFE